MFTPACKSTVRVHWKKMHLCHRAIDVIDHFGHAEVQTEENQVSVQK